MNPLREEYFRSLTEEEIMQLTYKDFLKSELEEILDELIIPSKIREEAKLYFIECKTIEEVSDILGIDRKTCSKHRIKLSYAIKKTVLKKFPRKSN